MSTRTLSSMLGVTMARVDVGAEEVLFTSEDGRTWRFYHAQNCCESVVVEDVCGDVSDLCGEPLVLAEETVSDPNRFKGTPPTEELFLDSSTWTFYRFATAKGYVTVRWHGSSNGFYSESVDIEEGGP